MELVRLFKNVTLESLKHIPRKYIIEGKYSITGLHSETCVADKQNASIDQNYEAINFSIPITHNQIVSPETVPSKVRKREGQSLCKGYIERVSHSEENLQDSIDGTLPGYPDRHNDKVAL